jgi:hypothetical protein
MAYGSGEPADYRQYSHFLSSQDKFNAADAWLFGDSIAFGGRGALEARVNALGKTIAFDTWSSRPTTPAVDELRRRYDAGETLPRRVVFAKGTNDIFNPTVMATQIQRVLDMTDDLDIDLVWVDTFVRREGYREADLINSAWVNEQIHDRALGMHIVHWHRLFASDKNRIAVRLRDGVHPRPEHQDFWAASVMGVLGPLLA